jgi:hypothetical protein
VLDGEQVYRPDSDLRHMMVYASLKFYHGIFSNQEILGFIFLTTGGFGKYFRVKGGYLKAATIFL